MHDIIKASIFAAIGVLVFASLLVPVVSDAMIENGEPATFENETYSGGNYTYNIWNGENITFEYTPAADSSTYLINGEPLTLYTGQRIVLASNDFASRSGGSTFAVLNSQYVDNTSQLNNAQFTFEVVDREYTLSLNNGGLVYTGKIDWLVYAIDQGNSDLIQTSHPSTGFYTSNANDIIVLGNIYTTGDNDTFYSYYKGQLTVNETYADDSSVTITKTLVNGYTDIYNTLITVTVGDETFTPYFILVPENVNGHTASGALYDMLGVLPIAVICVLIFGVLGASLYSRIE